MADLTPSSACERRGDRLGGDAELGEDPLVRSRRAETVYTDDPRSRSAPSPSVTPASTASRASTGGRQHGIPVVVVLLLEELPARHRDDAARSRRAMLRRLEREVHLGCRWRSRSPRARPRPLPEGVGPAAGRRRRPRPRCGRASAASAGSARARPGPSGALERDPPRHRRLVRVGGPHVPEVRDRPQRHVVLDRLMGRAVLADADRVVRPHPGACAARSAPRVGRRAACSRRRSGTSSRRAAASPASSAMPFTIEPIACSRIPKAMLRPACVAEKTPAPSNSVLFDSTRSADAADHRRRERLQRLHHLAAGVTRRDLLAGREHRQRLAPALARLAAQVELALARPASGTRVRPGGRARSSHSRCSSAPRSATTAMCSRTSSETANVRVGIEAHRLLGRARPRPRRAARRAPSRCRPRSAPGRRCGSAATISDGRSSSAFAAASAASSASRSSASSTCWTCQPYASKRCPRPRS